MAGDSKEVARAHLADAGVEELPDDWDVVTLGDLFTEDRGIAVGVMYPGDHDPDGVPLIKAGDLNGSIINPHPDFRISKDKHHEYRRTALEGGELLMTLVGNVGQCAVVPPRMAGWNTARAVAVMRLVDSSETHFVQQCLLSRPLQHLMDVWCNTTVQATLNLKEIRQLPLPWPPKQSRDAIAAFGKALDDKIELNRRMNATLEAMARALFQSWFVDFDPVRLRLSYGGQVRATKDNPAGLPAEALAKAGLDPATASLFPDSFQDSPIGPIPKGWSAARVGEVLSRIAMGPFGSRITRDNFVPEGVPVVRGGNLTKGFVDDDFVFLTESKADELKASVARPLDIVFTHRGTLGQVGIIPISARYPRYVVSQSQMLLSVDRDKLSPWAAYLFFSSPQGEAALLANTSTTGVPAISRPTTSLKAIPLVVPPIAVSKRFDDLVQPLFLQREQLAHQSRTLATLRDTLLPKLLSGELRVEHAS
jgi:restriction endonuclease S subunit